MPLATSGHETCIVRRPNDANAQSHREPLAVNNTDLMPLPQNPNKFLMLAKFVPAKEPGDGGLDMVIEKIGFAPDRVPCRANRVQAYHMAR
jgi:hypothetical protein